jgi:AraC family transcriptional regulator of adaptative response/methylated-DNA-[protein]-cysteine methyltransferase
MNEQQALNYQRIAEAIGYINDHFKEQPTLEEVASHVHLSPFHFQRLFSEWAGTTPKKFLQFISLEHARQLLREQKATLFDTALDIGLSGTGRLHDLFISMEGMTPAEYKNGGSTLSIRYSFAETLFGRLIVASTDKGICYMAFDREDEQALHNLRLRFPNAHFTQQQDRMQQHALSIFRNDRSQLSEIKLHLKGTPFQLKVWEALLKIPMGRLTTYGQIAAEAGNPGASRAVGTAIGSNPVAYLIPCHRVIQSTGHTGGYRWGSTRKSAMIGWECARRAAKKMSDQ